MRGDSENRVVGASASDVSSSVNIAGRSRATGAMKNAASSRSTPVQSMQADTSKAADKAEKKSRDGEAKVTDQKPKKAKVVRDSFTMPESDYQKLTGLKERCLLLGVQAKKSELLRAGVRLLAELSEKKLLAVVAEVESVKTDRPAKTGGGAAK